MREAVLTEEDADQLCVHINRWLRAVGSLDFLTTDEAELIIEAIAIEQEN